MRSHVVFLQTRAADDPDKITADYLTSCGQWSQSLAKAQLMTPEEAKAEARAYRDWLQRETFYTRVRREES